MEEMKVKVVSSRQADLEHQRNQMIKRFCIFLVDF